MVIPQTAKITIHNGMSRAMMMVAILK